MSFQDKVRRRAGDARAPHAAVAAGDFVPRSLLDTTRDRLTGELERRARALRSARRTEDDLVRALNEIRLMTEPATVSNYQGGHRSHVAAVNQKVRAVLAKVGHAPVAPMGGPK